MSLFIKYLFIFSYALKYSVHRNFEEKKYYCFLYVLLLHPLYRVMQEGETRHQKMGW